MNSAIIVAAGQGTRMGPQIDKIFLPIAGRPVVAHTWQQYENVASIAEIILVVRAGLESAFLDLAREYGFRKKLKIVIGGKVRTDSVWNGLLALDAQSEIVAIQDAARPCTSVALIEASLAVAKEHGAAVAAQAVTDTIKESADGTIILQHLDRSRLWAVQTPQTFRVGVIRKALALVREKGLQVTDDTAACELIGQTVKMVSGFGPNPKVTVPEDVPYIEMLLKSSKR